MSKSGSAFMLAQNVMVADVLWQHVEGASFDWIIRDQLVDAPHCDLHDLFKSDQNIEAHLDGLHIAGDEGWKLAKEQLGYEEPGEVFAASVLALESGDEERLDEVLQVASKDVEPGRGFISAMGWVGMPGVEKHLQRLLKAEAPGLKRLAVSAYGILRVDPGNDLIREVETDDVHLRARVYKAAGELGRRDLLGVLGQGIESDDEACRFWAAWSSGLMQQSYAVEALQKIAESSGRWSEKAADLAVRCMPREAAIKWQKKLAGDAATLRLGLQAAYGIGDPAGMPWILEMMKIDEQARKAGEVFTLITGVDIAYEDLEADWPEGFEAGPTEEPGDDHVDLDPDENLPWPNADLITGWWKQNQRRYRSGVSHMLGKPVNPNVLRETLRNGLQRQRAAAALELVLQGHDRMLFEVRAKAAHQKKLLGLWVAV